jgi:pantoate--beta-alanine ligase
MVELQQVRIVHTAIELHQQIGTWRSSGKSIAFVPTMGTLHEGHLSLVRRGSQVADAVVASIFINPAQFGPDEDLALYPRDPEGDAVLLASAGCELLFMPAASTIYPLGHSTWVDVQGPSDGFEGASRPGHFRGVATVVTQLLLLVQPDFAIFGQKDAQQLAVVRRLVRDFHLPVEIVGAPIVREDDGLAMSSRNVYLNTEERRAARVLNRSLQDAQLAIQAGERRSDELKNQILTHLEREPLAAVEYVTLVNAESFKPIEVLQGCCVLTLAVRFGKTRLLDNLHLELAELDTDPHTSSDDLDAG